jgi:hypothetical protein
MLIDIATINYVTGFEALEQNEICYHFEADNERSTIEF